MNTPASFRERAHAFQQSRVLLTAYELGVFTAVGREARTSAEVARTLGTDARATDRLMNALVALQLLEKHGDQFANGAFAARHLVSGTPELLSGLMHSVHLWTTWSTLTDAVRAGHAVAPHREGDSDDRWREAFIAACPPPCPPPSPAGPCPRFTRKVICSSSMRSSRVRPT